MADLSKQFDVVRTVGDKDPMTGERTPVHEYTALTKAGEWAGTAMYRPPKFEKSTWLDPEQVHVTGRGRVDVSRFHRVSPKVGEIAVAKEHRGKGLANHIVNHALSQAYRDDPEMRGDPDVIGSDLSPMSAPWKASLTGERYYPSWAANWEPDADDDDFVPDRGAMEQYTADRRLQSMPAAAEAWEAGERAPEPEGTIEDRKREFRGK